MKKSTYPYPHRPYKDGPALVDLLVAKFYDTHSHERDRYYAQRVNPDGETRLHYCRNADDTPGKTFTATRQEIRLAEYEFSQNGFRVTVYDDSGRRWHGGVRFRVCHLQLNYEAESSIRRDDDGNLDDPTVNFGTYGSVNLPHVKQMLATITMAIKLVEAETLVLRKQSR